MNVVELNPTVSDALRRTLAQLPEFDPPASRWLDVIAAHRARAKRPPRWRPWAAAAVLVAGAAGALVAGLGRPGATGTLVAEVERSRLLEQRLAEARVVRGAPALIAVEADLARVDGALQAAYDRGAAPAELEALWQQRTATLETLLAGYRHPDSLIRI